MTTSSNASNSVRGAKGTYEFLIFAAAVVTGTACSISSKVLYELRANTDDSTYFAKPVFQTVAMFVAMDFGLLMHWVVVHWKIDFPGYQYHPQPSQQENDANTTPRVMHIKHRDITEKKALLASSTQLSFRVPFKVYLLLVVPAVFDLTATLLCMVGLLYLDVSIFQLLRGSGIIFVALLRQPALHQKLYRFQWTGVMYNVLSVLLVGSVAILESQSPAARHGTLQQSLLGVCFMLAGTFVQAIQYVFEEKVMIQDEIKVPPLLLFGMEGLYGTVLGLFFLYPLCSRIPGDDDGSFEDFWNTMDMLRRTPSIQVGTAVYLTTVFGYNLFAVLVTFSLSSIWHSILDNFRPLMVWITDLAIYYTISRHFGEPWTRYSYVELGGMLVLIYGTAIYNAPDVGSIQLRGNWSSLWLDFSEEYHDIRAQRLFSTRSYPSLRRFISSSFRLVQHERLLDLLGNGEPTEKEQRDHPPTYDSIPASQQSL